MVAVLAIAAAATGPARAQIYGSDIDLSNGESGTLSSDMTCTYLMVINQGTLTVNQGVTLTLNCEEFNLKTNSAIHLHGTMTGSVGDEPDWNNNSYINVYLSDGAKYTVPGLECMDGYGYLRYYGYDAATDGHGTVSVTNGSAAVTASSIGYSSTTYTFTATPASGYHFVNWTKGAGGEELGTDASIDVTCEQNGQYQVYANFAQTPVPITVRMAAGTEEAANWSIATGNASVQGTQVLENVMSGSEVTATYNGTTKKVKSVKAVKYVPPAATVITAPTATAAIIEAGSTTALVNAGAANGGTMMYAVTTTNAQPASTADFSATRPTAEGRAAGTYYVWFYAKADAEHSDSEIAGPVSVPLAVMTTVTWNSTNVFNSAHGDDKILNTEWTSNPLTYEGVTISMSAFSEESVSSFNAYNEHDQAGGLTCFGEDGDSFTFTAPSGKMFCKIEIIDNVGITFDEYDDWTEGENINIVWSGTAANTVTLGTVYTAAHNINSIVFKLIDAQ